MTYVKTYDQRKIVYSQPRAILRISYSSYVKWGVKGTLLV